MKKLLIPLFIALTASAFAFASSVSAAEGKSMTPQQQKFVNCAHESKGMKGEQHKKFMSDCLAGKTHEMQAGAAHEGMAASSAMKSEKSKAHAAKNKMMTSREKMKTCSAEAKNKKLMGSERKAFMSECLRGGGK